MIPYILTDNSLTVVIEGKAHTMANTHPAFLQAQEALKDENWDKLKNMFDVSKAVGEFFDNDANIEVKDGAVHYNGEIVHNLVVDKILDFMRKNLPYQPLVKFLGKLMENPSHRAVDELYSFLEHKNMPLTPEGNFLAYKGVNSDFTDFYSGKFSNKVGEVLEMRRNGVCDDLNKGCSSGFHAGSYDYAKGYASGGGHLLVVEIDPSDVVSVPLCSDCQKLRTSKYKVVAVYETIEAPALDEALYESYDDEEADEVGRDEYNEGWFAGYQKAKQDIVDSMDDPSV
jgi:hypothetical protein